MLKAFKRIFVLFLGITSLALAWHRKYEPMSNCDVNSITADASSYVGDIKDIKVSHTRKGCLYTVKGSNGIAKFDDDGNLLYYKKKR
ncbi:MAG: hypothetical protein ACP5LI_04610 [Hydrogenobaculum sp.]|nr:MAG: hypothetical protein C0170_00955 [Hydrogenobaculum sp.]